MAERGQGKAAMATTQGAKTSDLSLKSRMIQALKIVMGKEPITNLDPNEAPFGPLQPLQPAYQEEMKGRQLDYLPGYNLIYEPRAEEATSFKTLRGFADTYDLLRLAIETRKDQLCRLTWSVRYKEKDKDPDDRCKKARAFFEFPDGANDWATWLRMLAEEVFVTDALTIYPQVNKGGDLLSLEVMDGALISRKIDASGRTPAPPDVAYQQIIKGLPAVDYCRLDLSENPVAVPGSELIYAPRNPRAWKFYGFSHVEQIIMTVNIALRRQVHQLQYYTEGSIPDSIVSCPPEWTADQVAHFQELFDTMLSGNTAERRKMRFIPGGTGTHIFDTKEKALKDEFDEWLARVICYCFSLPPTAFVKQNNRATADNAKEAAEEEGNAPMMIFIKSTIDRILTRFFGRDLELAWDEERDIDPLIQAQIDAIYLGGGASNSVAVVTADEVRNELGKKGSAPEPPPPVVVAPANGEADDPVKGGNKKTAGTAAVGANGNKGGAAKPKSGSTTAKAKPAAGSKKKPPVTKTAEPDVVRAKKEIPSIDRERDEITKARKELIKVLEKFFASEAAAVADYVSEVYDFASIAPEDVAATVDRIMAGLDMSRWATLIDPTEEALARIYQDGTVVAFQQIDFAPTDKMTSLMSERAKAYAEKRSADLVGMKNIGTKANPEWVVNKGFQEDGTAWAITDTTRTNVQKIVTESIENNHSVNELRQTLMDSESFSAYRAEMVARTELAFADVAGNMDAYRHSGIVTGKEWILGSEHDDDDDCDANADAGVIGLDDAFPSGTDAPPDHPNCLIEGAVVAAAGVTKHFKRWFGGEVVTLSIAGMDDLTITPNHPVLTDAGWIAAGHLKQGDNLLFCNRPSEVAAFLDPDDHYVETRIEQIADTLLVAGGMSTYSVPASAEAFHGDGTIDGEVEVVNTTGFLVDDGEALADQRIIDVLLSVGHGAPSTLDTEGAACEVVHGSLHATNSIMGSGSASLTGIRRNASGLDDVGITPVANSQTQLVETIPEGGAMAPDSPSNITSRLAGLVRLVKLDNISRGKYLGHVYNLQTKDSFYVAHNLIVHNCVCDVLPVLMDQEDDQ